MKRCNLYKWADFSSMFFSCGNTTICSILFLQCLKNSSFCWFQVCLSQRTWGLRFSETEHETPPLWRWQRKPYKSSARIQKDTFCLLKMSTTSNSHKNPQELCSWKTPSYLVGRFIVNIKQQMHSVIYLNVRCIHLYNPRVNTEFKA